MKKKRGQKLMVGQEKVIPTLYGMLFPIGCANIPYNKQPIEHVLKIPISKPGDRDIPYKKHEHNAKTSVTILKLIDVTTNIKLTRQRSLQF